MKRDWELIHEILKMIERADTLPMSIEKLAPGYFSVEKARSLPRLDLFKYNLRLLVDRGIVLVEENDKDVILGLSWKGHDLLDKLNDD